MPDISEALSQVDQLVEGNPAEAETTLLSLTSSMSPSDLLRWEFDLRQRIKLFFPKRRKKLTESLDRALRRPVENEPAAEQPPRLVTLDLASLRANLNGCLRRLSDRHIFQWSTFYRDELLPVFQDFCGLATSASQLQELAEILRSELRAHSIEIFAKGFSYQKARADFELAVRKGLNGLRGFLDLPVEYYSHAIGTGAGVATTTSLRTLTSASVGGIIQGFSNVGFGNSSGGQLLPRYQRTWASYLAFLDAAMLDGVLKDLEPGDFVDGVCAVVRPFIQALDTIVAKESDPLVPVVSDYLFEKRCLEISLRPTVRNVAPSPMVARCYLDTSYLTRLELQALSRADVCAVVARVRSDVWESAGKDQRIARLLINTTESENSASARQPLRQVIANHLLQASYEQRSALAASAPLTINFAKEFPLSRFDIPPFFHVHRSSVRSLLHSIEGQTGGRLWCSVRRSGKTTACFQLASSTGDTVVVGQTCSNTQQREGDNILYQAVTRVLHDPYPIEPDFLATAITECVGTTRAAGERLVLVLDEYERLFGLLRSYAQASEVTRYAVVLPLLDQMVAFTKQHLLIFLGQQPHAHFILMENNQLSAYLQQDCFPLFAHSQGPTESEFAQLVSKVLTARVDVDASFLEALYAETSGHPFLTVNTLVTLVDWLIEERRTLADLQLGGGDFRRFSDSKLDASSIRVNPVFDFFRNAVAEALSQEARVHQPWLHAMYSLLRSLAIDSPRSLSCSRSDYEALWSLLDLGSLGFSPDELLRTGSQANFLAFDPERVWPRVPVLARLAGVVQPRLTA